MRLAFAIAIVPMLFFAPGLAARERVVLLVENRSSRPDAASQMGSSIELSLQRKGYEIVSGPEVADFLEAVGSPHVEEMSARLIDKLLLRFQADRALAVTVSFFLEAQPRDYGPNAKPAVGISARLLDASGAVLWRNSMGAIGEDSGYGLNSADAVRRMGTSVCERLFWSFPKPRGIRPSPAAPAPATPALAASTAAAPAVAAPAVVAAPAAAAPTVEGPPCFPLLIRRPALVR
jgi:hypothetical protein